MKLIELYDTDSLWEGVLRQASNLQERQRQEHKKNLNPLAPTGAAHINHSPIPNLINIKKHTNDLLPCFYFSINPVQLSKKIKKDILKGKKKMFWRDEAITETQREQMSELSGKGIKIWLIS